MTNRVVQRTHHFLALGSHIRHVNQDVDRIELLLLDLLDKLCKLVISSSDGPCEDIADSFCDGASVEAVAALPLRWRSLYFSIASASTARMRDAIGDSPFAPIALWATDKLPDWVDGIGVPVGRGTPFLGGDNDDAADAPPRVLCRD